MTENGFLAIAVAYTDPVVKVLAETKEFKNLDQLKDKHPEGNFKKLKENSREIEKVENG